MGKKSRIDLIQTYYKTQRPANHVNRTCTRKMWPGRDEIMIDPTICQKSSFNVEIIVMPFYMREHSGFRRCETGQKAFPALKKLPHQRLTAQYGEQTGGEEH